MLLRTVAIAARRAVARPVAGTILTVADAAADAAEDALTTQAGDALAVARAAQRGGREALARTPQQLDVLAAAGVVDAGGQAYTLMVDVLVEVLGGEPAQPLSAVDPAEARRSGPHRAPPDGVRGDVRRARREPDRSRRTARRTVSARP